MMSDDWGMQVTPKPALCIDGTYSFKDPFPWTSYTITPLSNGQHDTEIRFHPGKQRFKLRRALPIEQALNPDAMDHVDVGHDRHGQVMFDLVPFEEDRPACDGWVSIGAAVLIKCNLKEGHLKRDGRTHEGTSPTRSIVNWK